MTAPMQYLLDGTDLANFARTLVTLTGDLPVVGDDDAVPYRPGEVFRRRVAGAGSIQIGMLVDGADGSGNNTVEQWQRNFADLKALVWGTQAARTLTRRMNTPSGVVESAASVALASLPSASMQGDRACLTTVEFKVLDGYLYGTSDVSISSPGTVTVQGDARTTRMTITLGAGVTLTNTTTGAAVTNNGAGTATIDVQNWTATIGGAASQGSISWPASGHDFWFDLAPGSNVLTGAATIVYRPAYLP
jgi:hypothetical protein